MKKLEGIYPALITPFDGHARVDEDALIRLADWLMAKGVSGFYLCGSTAEFLLLSKEERKRIVSLVTKHVAGRVSVIAHIGCQYTPDAIELARHAQDAGADAISSLPPIYYKYTLPELERYFGDLANGCELPLIVYNAPALTGIAFDSENIRGIFANGRVIGVKNTSYDLFQMERFLRRYPNHNIVNGHDELYLSTLALGARCAFGSTFNFMPEKFFAIRDAFEKNDLARARELQEQANTVIQTLIEIGVFRGVKGMLRLMGMACGECRSPFMPLSARELERLEQVLPLAGMERER